MRKIRRFVSVAGVGVLLSASGAGVALATSSGAKTYTGKTSQHQKFTMTASKKKVSKIAFNWVGTCKPSGKVTVPFSGSGLTVSHGKFTDSSPGYQVDTSKVKGAVRIEKLTGKVNGKKTSGSFSFQGVLSSSSVKFGACTGTGTWTGKTK